MFLLITTNIFKINKIIYMIVYFIVNFKIKINLYIYMNSKMSLFVWQHIYHNDIFCLTEEILL